jgi:hypothetical protein
MAEDRRFDLLRGFAVVLLVEASAAGLSLARARSLAARHRDGRWEPL